MTVATIIAELAVAWVLCGATLHLWLYTEDNFIRSWKDAAYWYTLAPVLYASFLVDTIFNLADAAIDAVYNALHGKDPSRDQR